MDVSLLYVAGFLVFMFSSFSVILYIRNKQLLKKKSNLETKYQELEREFNGLKLENLESKLNPHLFKNILNSIQSHAYQTYFALDKLAGILDYILYESRKGFVTPREEIEFALKLIEINKVKVSPLFELKVKTNLVETEPLYEQKVLMPLITVDLIENAFKHADLQSSDAFISIVFEFKDHCLTMNVANKISGKPALKKEKSGFGSETLEHRLNMIYKNCFKLDRFVEKDVFIAHLKINLLEYQSKMFVA